ncbi:isochorismatase family protein [Patescibacteria group bacterium]|nr:isochorismatase family protein [Patescibacteria group bacterium]
MNKKYSFIAIDLQNDFTSEGGLHYVKRESVDFLTDTLFPYFQEKGMEINEIISDYRQPRQGDTSDCCRVGEWGYESIIPRNIVKSIWIKAMNSPIWTRENIGDATRSPGLPYQDTKGFGQWLKDNIGNPGETTPVLCGLTIDCCVLSTLQELSWRGYYPIVLKEGVDHYSGKIEDRDKMLETPVPNWAEVITWDELKNKL